MSPFLSRRFPPWMVLLGLAWSVASGLWAEGAEHQISERWEVSRGGRVEIEVPGGRLQVIGWDRQETVLDGHVGSGVAEPTSRADGQKVRWISTALEGSSTESRRVELTLQVPRHCHLVVRGFDAEVRVRGLRGLVDVQTLDGDIRIEGQPDEVTTRTVSGDQVLTVESRRLTSRSLVGLLKVSGEVHALEASSVSGGIDIDSRLVGEVKLRSTSGRISFSGEILPTGRLDVETTGGDVDFDLADGSHAEVHLETRNGHLSLDIANSAHVNISEHGAPYLEAADRQETGAETAESVDSREGSSPEGSGTARLGAGGRRQLVLGDGGPRLTAISQWGDLRLVYRSST